MPAIITHDIFGRDTYDVLFNFIGGSRDEADAFLLGNQGPDPLFYAFGSPRLYPHRELGSTIHKSHPTELVKALKDSLSILNPSEAAVGRAFALGFLCHYTLDSTVHPLVYSYQKLLCEAGVDGLTPKDTSEVHTLIESEYDELLLYKKRGVTVAEFNPATEILCASDTTLKIISKMIAYIALTVYGEFIPQNMYEKSLKNMRIAQRALHSTSGRRRALWGHLERLARTHSLAQALSHRAIELEESSFENTNHQPWKHPFTGQTCQESFQDLYDQALDKAKRNIYLFEQGVLTTELARQITGDMNFSGDLTATVIVSVESL